MTSRVKSDASAFDETSNSSSSSNRSNPTSTSHSYSTSYQGSSGSTGCEMDNVKIGKYVETTQKVTLNDNKKVYEKDARKIDITAKNAKITDCNLGLTKTIGTGSGPATIKNCFTPEELVMMVLKSGITGEDLKKLLDNKFSIKNLAFALEGNRSKEIITALTSVCSE